MTEYGLEKQLRSELDKLPNDESKLKFLQEETHFANPEACWGGFVIDTCNRLAVEIMANTSMDKIVPGVRVKVFDHRLFKNDRSTPLSETMKPAVVVRIYDYVSRFGLGMYPNVADVVFDYRPNEVSKAHFTEFIEIM